MKAKIAPTSPKTEHDLQTMEQLYGSGSSGIIDRPPRVPLGLVLLFSLFAGVVGVVGGFAGLTALQHRLPNAGWLRWFTPLPAQTVVVNQGSNPTAVPTRDRRDVVAPTIVGVYQGVATAPTAVTELPTPLQYRGNGVIVSNTGVILTTREVVPEPATNLVILTTDQRLLAVRSIERDPATPYVFLKVEGNNFASAKFAAQGGITPGQEGFGMSVGGSVNSFSLAPLVITALQQRLGASFDTILDSSENLERVILVSRNDLEKGSPVVTADGHVIGLALSSTVGGRQALAPLWDVTPALRQVLRGTDVVRPTLGVSYISLGQTPTLSRTPPLPSTGALVTTFDPVSRPAITPRSPAAIGQIKSGDVIKRVGDTNLDATTSLADAVQGLNPGASPTLLIDRGGEEETITVKLGTRSSP